MGCLPEGTTCVPIPGTKRRRYLEENAAAVDITLSAAQVSELDSIFPPDVAAGERYAPHMMALINR